MKYFSMFSGIGGFELGIQQAYESIYNVDGNEDRGEQKDSSYDERQGFLTKTRQGISSSQRPTCECSPDGTDERPLCIGYSEINKYAIQVYEKHFNHKNYGDCTTIIPSELPDFDCLVGGFPCQAFSIAGKRKGFDDTRGTLFFDIARICADKKPRLVVLENVKGLLSHDNGNTFTTIIRVLSTMGYFVEWQVLNAKNFGVPQNRERVFIIGHLGGQPKRKVFPITGSNPKTLNQIIEGGQGNRVYDTDGISTAQASQAGGQGAKTGLYAVLTPDRPTKRQNGRRIKNDGESSFTLTGQDIHGVSDGMRIRCLTPLECERLMGFPEVEKSCIIEVCLDQPNNNVNVENQNHKSQKLVGNVVKKELKEGVKFVNQNLNTKNQQTEDIVQKNVLIYCDERGVQISSQGRLLLNASYAEKKNWFHQHIKIDNFVQMLVGINTIVEKIVNSGGAELHQNGQYLIHQENGKKLVRLFGKEIMRPVGDVESDLTTLKELLKSTTLNHLDIGSLEQKLKTLSFFVIRAIIGFIPDKIKNQNIFMIEIKTKFGWTAKGIDDNGNDVDMSDTQRYKCCGNAVVTNVVKEVFIRLLTKSI